MQAIRLIDVQKRHIRILYILFLLSVMSYLRRLMIEITSLPITSQSHRFCKKQVLSKTNNSITPYKQGLSKIICERKVNSRTYFMTQLFRIITYVPDCFRKRQNVQLSDVIERDFIVSEIQRVLVLAQHPGVEAISKVY